MTDRVDWRSATSANRIAATRRVADTIRQPDVARLAFVAAFAFVAGWIVCAAVVAIVPSALAAPAPVSDRPVSDQGGTSVVAAAMVPTTMPAPTTAPAVAACDFPAGMPDAVAQGETFVRQAAADNGMDCRALALLWSIEAPHCYGNGVGNCVSPSGALGPGQVMPGTAYEIEAATGWPCTTQAHDTLTSLRCGAWYYVQRMRQASSVWRPDDEAPNLGVAGACYNAGPVSAACAVALATAKAGGDPCAAIVGYSKGEPSRWCQQVMDGWRRLEAAR